MTTVPADAGLAAAFDGATASAGGVAEKNVPPAGHVGELAVTDSKIGKKDADLYFVVEYQDGPYSWSEFKWLTKNGQGDDGRKTSVKILVTSLGFPLDNPTLAQLGAVVQQVKGRRYTYQQVAAKQINTVTGAPYVNTEILGAAPDKPIQQVAPAQATVPGASFGDDVPWDQPAATAAPANAVFGG